MTDDRRWELPQKNLTMREYVTQVMADKSRDLELKNLIEVYGMRRLELLISNGSMREQIQEENKQEEIK